MISQSMEIKPNSFTQIVYISEASERSMKDSIQYYRSSDDNILNTNKRLTLVISCYTFERASDLLELFDSVRMQKLPIELVIVIERDAKLKQMVLQYLSDSNLEWRMIYSQTRLGLSNARNLGVLNSTSPLIGFVDDDAILFPDWAENAIDAFHRYPDVIGITGLILPKWIGSCPTWFPRSMYWIIGCSGWKNQKSEELGNFLSGVNMIFRKEVFGLATFDDKFTDGAQGEGKLGLPNEDNDFAIRLVHASDRKILFTNRLRVFHKVPTFKLTNKYIRRYAFWQGVAEARYDRKYGSSFRNQSRKVQIQILIHDLVERNVNFQKRCTTLLTFLTFGALGFISYRSTLLTNSIAKRL
jgi:GT2 family glycosyltransferase